MKTKDKILHTALQLFNKHGVPNITLRRIAGEMGISQGNLNYYFKKREEIIEALYYQLLVKFEEERTKLDVTTMDMKFIIDSNKAGMESLYQFRFLMIDFNQIMRENPKIHAHFIELEKVRKVTYLKSFEIAMAMGYMRPPEFPGEYENFADRIRVFGDSWIASEYVYHLDEQENAVSKNQDLLVEMFYPYFTEKGKTEFLELHKPGK